MIKTFTQLKKEADHFSWELYQHDAVAKENAKAGLYGLKKVIKKQTNAVMFDTGSWLYFNSAAEFKLEPYLYNDSDTIVTVDLQIPDKPPFTSVMKYHLRPIN